jgi:hypothetical protein
MKPVLNETGEYRGGFYYGVIVCNGWDGRQAESLFFLPCLEV